MRSHGWMAAFLALLLLGCGRAPLATEADGTARSFFEAVRTADWPAVDRSLAPEAVAAAGHLRGFEAARKAIPGGALGDVRAVGWARTKQNDHKRLTAVHLYRYPGADLVVSTVLERVPPSNGYKVVGFYLNRPPPGAVEANRFTLAGKPLRQLMFLVSALMSPMVMAGVALLVILSPWLTWKPAWFALCFVGVGQAYLNWTSGQSGFEWAQIGVINFGATRATDISPWIVRFSAPVGALAALARLLAHRGP